MAIPRSELNKLGRFLRRYRIDLPNKNVSVLVGLLIWFSCGLLYVFVSGDVLTLSLGIFFLVSGMFLLAKTTLFKSKKRFLLLYENGIIVEKKNQQRLAYYRELKVWQKIINPGNIPLPTSYRYIIQFPDRTRLFIPQRYIGERLQSMVVKHQLPHAMATYWQGDDVQFGALSINRQKKQITIGSETISWSEVETVTIEKGFIYIKQKNNKFPGMFIAVADVPNIHILLHLLKTIMRAKLEV